MRLVTFQNVLHGVAARLGLNPLRDLNAARAATLTEYLNTRLDEGWRKDFWPEWTRVEARAFRPPYSPTEFVNTGAERYFLAADRYYQWLRPNGETSTAPATLTNGEWIENSTHWAECQTSYDDLDDWVAGTVYAVGDQVRDTTTGNLYQCHTAHTAGAAFAAGNFGRLTNFERRISYEPDELETFTPIQEVKRVTRRDPRRYQSTPGTLGFFPAEEGVIVTSTNVPTIVHVEFRLRCPVFTSTLWAAGTAYNLQDLVYYAPDCYRSLVGNNTGELSDTVMWERVRFPYVLANFVKRAAAADALNDQKQTDRARAELYGAPGNIEDRGAYGELDDAWDREFSAQGLGDQAVVRAYGR